MTNEPVNTTPIGDERLGEVLPEFWPAPAGTPRVRPVWIPWPLAVVLAPLLWLMPRRFGPHFAAAGWRAAIAGFVVWGTYGAATIGMAATAGPDYGLVTWLVGRSPEQMGTSLMPVATLSEVVRGPLAFWVGLAAWPANGGSPPSLAMVVLVPLLGMLGLAAAVTAVALVLMPYLAAGERTRLLLGRTVRLVMWAATASVVVGWAMQAMLLAGWNGAWCYQMVYLAGVLWVMSLVIRAGGRYAGPAEGPAWQRGSPICEQCGYVLTALPVSGRCPECGKAVAESQPDKRLPSRFAAARSLVGQVGAFWRTAWGVLHDRTFFTRLQMRDAHPGARRFAVWVCGLTSVVCPVLFFAIEEFSARVMRQSRLTNDDWVILWGGMLWVAVAMVPLLGLVALVVSRFGWGDVQRRSAVVFYWSVWLPVMGVCWLVVLGLARWVRGMRFFQRSVNVSGIGWVDICDTVMVVIVLAMIGWAGMRLLRAIRQTRHANG